jgi:hypothetical protein
MHSNHETPTGLAFDPAVLARLREIFHHHTCARCAAPATRLRADRYYCDAHFPRRPREVPPPRVYRVQTG